MAGEELGTAIFDLAVDQNPFDAGLKDAKARAALTVAQIQAMFDSLHLTVDPKISELNVAASRLESAAAAGSTPAAQSSSPRPGAVGGLWGVRGPEKAGSIENPLVMVQEAGKYTPLGTRAAAVGEDSTSDAQTGSGVMADAQDIQGLKDEIGRLVDVSGRLSSASRLGEENGANPWNAPWATGMSSSSSSSGSDAQTQAAMLEAADALSKIQGRLTQAERSQVLESFGGSSSRSTTRTSETTIYNYNYGSDPGTTAAGGSGSGGGGRGEPPVAYGSPEPGGGGNRRTDIYYHSSREGQGGSRTLWNPVNGLRTEKDTGDAFSLANLFKGDEGRGGAFGLPGFGSVGSLAGLGLEHWALTGAGLAASAGSAIGGGGLLAASGLTSMAVGGGSDALVSKDTITQAKDLYTNVQALDKAIAVYGAGSKQAAAAQYDLNQQWAELGGGAGKEAIQNLDSNVSKMKKLFDTESTGARVEAAGVMDQIVKLGISYVPLVTAAAKKNLGIINTGIKPLMTWLEGGQGKGIFETLEDAFARDLPTSIHAFDMGLEDFLRLMAVASQYTGGLARDLNRIFTDKSRESTAQYDVEVQKLVGDLHEWSALLKVLGEDMGGIFQADAGTANSIVYELTQMLTQLHNWEQSTTGHSDLDNIFAVHKQEIDELLELLPHLLSGYGDFYLTVAPGLVSAVTDIAKALNSVLSVVEKIPGGGDLVGLTLVLGKLGMLGPGLKLTAAALGSLTGAEEKNFGPATKDAAANTGLDASLGARGGVAGSGVSGAAQEVEESEEVAGGLGLSALLKGGLPYLGMAAGGTVIGSVGQSALGVRSGGTGTLAGGAGGAAAGAAIGSLTDWISGPFGTLVGASLGATFGPTIEHALSSLFGIGSGQDYGKQFAAGFVKPFKTEIPASLEASMQTVLAKQTDAARKASLPTTTVHSSGRGGDFVTQGPVNDVAKAAEWTKAGLAAADLFDSSFSTGVVGGGVFAQDAIAKLMQIRPGDARDEAAKTMVEFAQGLIAKKQMPAGAMVQIISAIEGKFPDLNAYLKTQSVETAKEIAAAFKLTDAQGNLKTTLGAMRTEFHLYSVDPDVTGKNWLNTTGQTMGLLGESYRQGVKGAGQAFDQLKQHAGAVYDAMQQKTSASIGAQKNAIASGSKQAADQAGTNFEAFATHVDNAMKAGVLSSSTGAQLIATALNNALVDFGSKPLPIPQSVQWTLGTLAEGGALGAAAAIPGAASGGLMQIGQPGQAGRDTVPLNVNGTPIMVGSGEQVAVFNRHQQPIVNAALSLAGYGGLAGLFGAVTTPNYMASGGVLGTAHVSGSGTVRDLTQTVVDRMAKAASSYLNRQKRSGNGSGSAIPGGGGALSQKQLEALWDSAGGEPSMAHLMAAIADAESSGRPNAHNASGASGLWQILGLPFAGDVFNPLTNAKMAVAKYLSQGLGAWTTYTSGAYEHFMARGGLPGFAGGGLLSAGGYKTRMGSAIPAPDNDIAQINQLLALLSGLVGPTGSGGQVGSLAGQLSYHQSLWGTANPYFGGSASSFILTDANGNPYIDTADAATTLGEYNTELNSFINPSLSGLSLGQAYTRQVMPKIRTAISTRQAEIKRVREQAAARVAKIKATIRANLRAIAGLQNKITKAQKDIDTEQSAKKPNYAKISGLKKQITGWQAQIQTLESQNKALGGDETDVGTGGQIGSIQSQATASISSADSEISKLQSTYTTLGGYGSALFAHGTATSAYGQDQEQQAQVKALIAGLSSTSLAAALTAAASSNSTSSTSAQDQTLAALYEQQAEQNATAYEISQRQYEVLSQLPSFGGSFAKGGVVPGALGAPSMILAHGGEVITPVGVNAQQVVHQVIVHDGAVDPSKIEVIAGRVMERENRKTAHTVKRALPSRGGGGYVTRQR